MKEKISLKDYKETLNTPIKERTLCFLVKDKKVLLGLKKSGFGQGNWLGVGGKVEGAEEISQAAIRETIEEVGVKPIHPARVATLDFYFPYVENPEKWDQRVCVFLVRKWTGDPIESEEMFPKWFEIENIPFGMMWSDAPYWLPKILQGVALKGEFILDRDLKVQEVNIAEGGCE